MCTDFEKTLKDGITHPTVEDDSEDVYKLSDERAPVVNVTANVTVSGVDEVMKKAMEDAQVAMKEAQEGHKSAVSAL